MKSESFLPVPSDLLKRQDITATTKLVMAYIQYRSNLEGWTFNPTNVAGELGISYRSAQRELKQLEADGIIKCIGYTKTLHHSYKKYAVVTKLNLSQVEPTSDKLSQVEPTSDKLSQVEPTSDKLSQVEPTSDKLSQVEPTSDKMGANFGQNVMSNFGQNVLLQEVQEKEVVQEVHEKEVVQEVSIISTEKSDLSELRNQENAFNLVSVVNHSMPLASPKSMSNNETDTLKEFGAYFNDFGTSNPIYKNIKPETKTSLERVSRVFDKTGYKGLDMPSMPPDSIGGVKVSIAPLREDSDSMAGVPMPSKSYSTTPVPTTDLAAVFESYFNNPSTDGAEKI